MPATPARPRRSARGRAGTSLDSPAASVAAHGTVAGPQAVDAAASWGAVSMARRSPHDPNETDDRWRADVLETRRNTARLGDP